MSRHLAAADETQSVAHVGVEQDPMMRARHATRSDVAEVLRVAAIMFDEIGSPIDSEWSREAERHFSERLGQDAAVLVVDSPDESGRLIAVGAGVIQRRLPVPGRPSGLSGFVQWVATEPDYRRRGASRAVMTALMSWFAERGVEVVELHATPPSRALYRSLGFSEPAGLNLRWLPSPPS